MSELVQRVYYLSPIANPNGRRRAVWSCLMRLLEFFFCFWPYRTVRTVWRTAEYDTVLYSSTVQVRTRRQAHLCDDPTGRPATAVGQTSSTQLLRSPQHPQAPHSSALAGSILRTA
jgi:hypothetical protein